MLPMQRWEIANTGSPTHARQIQFPEGADQTHRASRTSRGLSDGSVVFEQSDSCRGISKSGCDHGCLNLPIDSEALSPSDRRAPLNSNKLHSALMGSCCLAPLGRTKQSFLSKSKFNQTPTSINDCLRRFSCFYVRILKSSNGEPWCCLPIAAQNQSTLNRSNPCSTVTKSAAFI